MTVQAIVCEARQEGLGRTLTRSTLAAGIGAEEQEVLAFMLAYA